MPAGGNCGIWKKVGRWCIFWKVEWFYNRWRNSRTWGDTYISMQNFQTLLKGKSLTSCSMVYLVLHRILRFLDNCFYLEKAFETMDIFHNVCWKPLIIQSMKSPCWKFLNWTFYPHFQEPWSNIQGLLFKFHQYHKTLQIFSNITYQKPFLLYFYYGDILLNW